MNRLNIIKATEHNSCIGYSYCACLEHSDDYCVIPIGTGNYNWTRASS